MGGLILNLHGARISSADVALPIMDRYARRLKAALSAAQNW